MTRHDEQGAAGVRAGRRSRALRAVGIGLAGALVLGAAGAGRAYWHLGSNIRSVDVNSALGDDRPAKAVVAPSASASATAAPLPTGAPNILVLGSDSRSGTADKELGGGDSGGARSDTAMVVHVDAGRTSATAVSIPRDTLVTRPSCPLPSGGSSSVSYGSMFNSAFELGGPVCAVKTVESITRVRVDHFAQTLAVARTRHGIGDGSDLGRTGLQQKLVKALLTRISATDLLTDPARLHRVADAVTASITTDTGLDSLGELTELGRSRKGLSADRVTTVMMPVVTARFRPQPGGRRGTGGEPPVGLTALSRAEESRSSPEFSGDPVDPGVSRSTQG